MDLKLIRNLVRIMERGDVSELEVADEPSGLRVHLKRGAQGGAPVMMMPGTALAGAGASGRGDAASDDGDLDGGPAGHPDGVEEITSPMVGTFYRAPSPESDPFASVGTTVGEESVVCIIEAMKVMNEIQAETSGAIVEVLVENGDPVEFGQPLFLVKTR